MFAEHYELQELVVKDYPFTRGLSKPGHQPSKGVLVERFRLSKMLLTAAPMKQIACRMIGMSSSPESQRTKIEERLHRVNQQLRSEMLARGFDPDQEDNVALTGPLAKLYLERENLKDELESLVSQEISQSE